MDKFTEKIKAFIKRYSNYNASTNSNVVEKVWNHGHGSLALFRFYPESETILINELLCNKTDRTRLDEFCRMNGISGWKKAVKLYGYPEYYFHSFRI